jgi:hypothetical protein
MQSILKNEERRMRNEGVFNSIPHSPFAILRTEFAYA